jgi:hypothetical protein
MESLASWLSNSLLSCKKALTSTTPVAARRVQARKSQFSRAEPSRNRQFKTHRASLASVLNGSTRSKYLTGEEGEEKMSIPVCTGGDAPNGASSVTFTNALAVPVTITSCTIPGWPQSPAPDPVVPAALNGVNGTKTVQLSVLTRTGTYTYVTDPACNTIGTPPEIKVQ